VRSAPSEAVRSPLRVPDKDTTIFVGRGLLGGAIGAAVLALTPSNLHNETNEEIAAAGRRQAQLDQIRSWQPQSKPAALPSISLKPNGRGFWADIFPGKDTFVPPVLPLAPARGPGNPKVDAYVPTKAAPRSDYYTIPPLEWEDGLEFYDDAISRAYRERANLEMRDLGKDMPTGKPVREVKQAALVSVTVAPGPLGHPRVHVRVRYDRERALSRPRYSDSKTGRKLMGVMLSVVNKTYGVYSEAADMVEVMSWSMYGVDRYGVVRPAMTLTDRSMAEVFQGYMEGRFKLDTVGFVQDYAMQQLGDVVQAKIGRYVDDQMRGIGYESPLGYTSETLNQVDQTNEFLSSSWSSVSDRVRAADVRRAERVRSLF
jgi:hypothetical protein